VNRKSYCIIFISYYLFLFYIKITYIYFNVLLLLMYKKLFGIISFSAMLTFGIFFTVINTEADADNQNDGSTSVNVQQSNSISSSQSNSISSSQSTSISCLNSNCVSSSVTCSQSNCVSSQSNGISSSQSNGISSSQSNGVSVGPNGIIVGDIRVGPNGISIGNDISVGPNGINLRP
jgi:hypothetical protein